MFSSMKAVYIVERFPKQKLLILYLFVHAQVDWWPPDSRGRCSLPRVTVFPCCARLLPQHLPGGPLGAAQSRRAVCPAAGMATVLSRQWVSWVRLAVSVAHTSLCPIPGPLRICPGELPTTAQRLHQLPTCPWHPLPPPARAPSTARMAINLGS